MQKDRRQDGALREAIDRIRSYLNKGKVTDSSVIFQSTLIEMCSLTESPLGFVVRCNSNSPLKLSFICAHGTTGKLPADNSFQSELLKNVVLHRRSQVFQGNELVDFIQGGQEWPRLNSILAIPISDSKSLYGVLCLANAPKAYHTNIAKRAWPLMANAACVLRLTEYNQREKSHPTFRPENNSWQDTFLRTSMMCPIGMITLNTNHKIQRINPEAEKIFKVTQHDALNKEIIEFIPERYANEHRTQTFIYSPMNGTQDPLQLEGRTSKGDVIRLEVTHLSYQENGENHIILMVRDNSELDAIRVQKETQLQRFKAVADLAPIGILQTNAQWEAVYANSRWCEISGRPSENVMSMGWIGALHSQDFEATIPHLRVSIGSGKEFSKECRFETPQGKIVWVEMHARPLFTPSGDVNGFIMTVVDCSFRHEAEEKLRDMAEKDPLTGLANRSLFKYRLDHALERTRRHGAIALLCLDLDGFKNVNDSLGHDAGDLLLIEVARRINRCVREEDTVARVGGDEFLVLLEDLNSAETAADISEKILQALHPHCLVNHQEVFISTSIGITFAVGETRIDAKTLMKQADLALYRAKNEGRNNYQYYSPELEKASRDRLYLGNSLHHAMRKAEFEVYYQLQGDLKGGHITGTEALLRWNHEVRGLLQPSEFIPLMEETGLIVPVTRWLMHESFFQQKKWMDEGVLSADTTMSINLSRRMLHDPQFLWSLEGALKDSGLSGKNIIVEITETALLEESRQIDKCLKKMKSLGISIALDDFGTGYSSLTYLKRYPIDHIKIDQSFVRDLLKDSDDRAITQAVLALAHSLNLSVIAEGVENREVLELLREWGCDSYQGYHLNKPCPHNEIASILANRHPARLEIQQ